MAPMPRYPSLFQINTRVWLQHLSRKAGGQITLADVEEATIDKFAQKGFDWIWLLSIWQTGAAGRAVSRGNLQWRSEFKAVLPDLTEEDICGSGFAITAYTVSKTLGGQPALTKFREKLARRGIKLMLDFVPNHTAPDHPWVKTHPDYYVQANEAAMSGSPQNYMRVESNQGSRILAYGRDPNYPGWPDTLQLNYANSELREPRIDELIAISDACDGVRCDMAMLLLPEVFQRTWGITPEPFWPQATEAVRKRHPNFVFLAEVYWDLEWSLQQQGFDYCYDKRLYDRLKEGAVRPIHDHLLAGLDYQDKLARFLENHDEPRAAAVFAWPRHRAAAVITFLSPGLRFFYQGQFEGARVHVPTHLCRGPVEPINQECVAFYATLLRILTETNAFRNGLWSQIDPEPAWPGNWTSANFVAYDWKLDAGGRYVVVVNYSQNQSQCRLKLRFPGMRGTSVRLSDVMGTEIYVRDGSELVDSGLYIDHAAWHFNVFKLEVL
jgi:glycosidase